MFVLNIRPAGRKKLIIAAAAAISAVAAICAVCALLHTEKPADSAVGGAGEYSLSVQNEGYREFFEQLGIESENEPEKAAAVTIPAEFNKTYDDYNALQKHAGLDLSRYKGEDAELLTFRIKSDSTPFAVLLVKDGRVIGGHLTNGEYGGEMLTLC